MCAINATFFVCFISSGLRCWVAASQVTHFQHMLGSHDCLMTVQEALRTESIAFQFSHPNIISLYFDVTAK